MIFSDSKPFCITIDGPPIFHLPQGWDAPAPAIVPAIRGDRVGCPPTFTQPPGAWGCWRSHCRLWEDVFNLSLPAISVFEEDCLFRDWDKLPEFLAAVPDDWDMIYLGGQHLAPRIVTATPGVCRGTNINRTHAYIVRANDRTRAAYWRLCDMTPAAGKRQHVDYVLGEMHRSGTLTAYCPSRWFCGQAAGTSGTNGATYTSERWFD